MYNATLRGSEGVNMRTKPSWGMQSAVTLRACSLRLQSYTKGFNMRTKPSARTQAVFTSQRKRERERERERERDRERERALLGIKSSIKSRGENKTIKQNTVS